jgi:hypothetical protein
MLESLLCALTQLATDLEQGVKGAPDRVNRVLKPIHEISRDDVDDAQLQTLQEGVTRVQTALGDQRKAVMDAFRVSRKKAVNVRRFNNLRAPRTAQRLRKRV